MKFLVIIAAICITSTLGLLNAVQREVIFPKDSICRNKISSDDATNVARGNLAVSDPAVKCYITCILTNLGVLNSQNNFDSSTFLTAAHNLGFTTRQAMKLHDQCSSIGQNIVDDGICVNGFELWKCLVSAIRHAGNLHGH